MWGRQVVILVRVIVLALCVAISFSAGLTSRIAVSLMALCGLALVMSLPLPPRWIRISPLIEAALAAAVIASVPTLSDAPLLYLVVPALAAGLISGFVATLIASAVTAISFVVVRALTGATLTANDRTMLIQWIGLGILLGLVGSWGHAAAERAKSTNSSYAQANRLLTQLRDLARTLPIGFDEVAIAGSLLDGLQREFGATQAIVSTMTDGGRLTPLISAGADRAMWGAGTPEGGWAQAVESGEAVTSSTQLDDSPGHSLIVALRLGDRRLGVCAISRPNSAFTAEEIGAVTERVADACLQLDTGRLFSEVRALATVEERRRLAREIHDGIAQELAGMSFVVDDLSYRTTDLETRSELITLRHQLTQMISELRLSIFDLRTQVEPTIGLGTALGDHVRQVGAMAGLTVHLELNEDVRRLGIETETELLHIAQEAIANARRHAHARNLWVTLRTDPPQVLLRIADDGIGITDQTSDRFGLIIMAERAERIGAQMIISDREGGGTTVEVSVSSPTPDVERDSFEPLGRGN